MRTYGKRGTGSAKINTPTIEVLGVDGSRFFYFMFGAESKLLVTNAATNKEPEYLLSILVT